MERNLRSILFVARDQRLQEKNENYEGSYNTKTSFHICKILNFIIVIDAVYILSGKVIYIYIYIYIFNQESPL